MFAVTNGVAQVSVLCLRRSFVDLPRLVASVHYRSVFIPRCRHLSCSSASFSASTPSLRLAMKEKESIAGKSDEPSSRFAMKIPDNVMMVWRDATVVRKKSVANHELTPGVGRGEWDVSLVFEFYRDSEGRSDVITMRRPMTDSFSQTVKRIQMKLRGKKKEANLLEDVDIQLDGIDVNNSDLTNRDVLWDGPVKEMYVGGKAYRLVRDAVDCSALRIHFDAIVGCPIMAAYDLRAGFCEANSPPPTFHWYVGPKSLGAVPPVGPNFHEAGYPRYTMDGWTYRHTGDVYVPSEDDIGLRICVLIEFGADTIARCTLSNSTVCKPDEPFIFEKRQLDHCQNIPRKGFRVMSYNVLADLYLDLDSKKQEELYFPFCPKEYQSYAYRIPLLLREIPGYKADLMMLQEVDERLRRRYLVPFMANLGYDMCFKKKGLLVNEGLVICFRRDLFKLLSTHDMWLPHLLDTELFPENVDVSNVIDNDFALKELFMTRPGVIQLLALECQKSGDEGNVILAANTHLHFDPRHQHVKLLQTLLCARLIRRVAAEIERSNGGKRCFALFGGDFNSDPPSSVYQLLSTGEISGEHDCWKSGTSEPPSRLSIAGDDAKGGVRKFRSLAGDPPVTNYTLFRRADGSESGYAGCLDYIWGDSAFKVNSIVEMPSEELMRKHIALPSKICPSDHLPLICDVEIVQ